MKEQTELVKVTINLTRADWEYLQTFGGQGYASKLLRRILSSWVAAHKNPKENPNVHL